MNLKCYSFWKPLPDIRKTWSGTSYALYEGLGKYYTCSLVDRNKTLIPRAIWKYSQKKHLLFLEKIFYNLQNVLLQRQLAHDDMVFMISAVLKVKNPTYLFFDNIWATENLLLSHERSIKGKWSFRTIFNSYSKKQLDYNIRRQYEIMKDSKAIFVMGKWLEEFIKVTYPELGYKTYAVGGGINCPVFKSECRLPNSILFVGSSFYTKGGDLVVEAYKLLKQRISNLTLTIAGPKQKPEEVTDDINFLGVISNDDVSKLMLSHSVFCMPSRFDAYGLVFVEALVNGMPCIGRKAWEMPYFIEEGVTGELIDDDDVEELASKIERVLNSPQYGQNVQSRHDYYVQEYSWKNVCKRISDIIK